MVSFTPFFKLNDLAFTKVDGVFNADWQGDYHRVVSGDSSWSEPTLGSGVVVGSPVLRDNADLPNEVAKLENKSSFVYCIVSDIFPILYVGISEGDLRNGIFGAGRLQHHIRKLVASIGGSTNHTKGWRNHAGLRHKQYRSIVETGENVIWVDDIHISFAQFDSPKQIEGTVLDCFLESFSKQRINAEVFNRAKVMREPAKIELAENLDEILVRYRETREGLETFCAEFNSQVRDYSVLTSFANDEDGRVFELLLRWARTYNDSEMLEGVVKGYTNQPRGYNAKPVVRFAELGRAGKAMPHRWLCRIPLKTTATHGMTIILPERLKRATLPQTQYVQGSGTNFRPVYVEDFLSNPDRYLV
tara:strand:- start:1181 stop:2260 length:1080 start_codon:yes stop_codon:yes gene_type:complete